MHVRWNACEKTLRCLCEEERPFALRAGRKAPCFDDMAEQALLDDRNFTSKFHIKTSIETSSDLGQDRWASNRARAALPPVLEKPKNQFLILVFPF